MRLLVLSILLASLFAGCNADPRYRRETALLRAEILDLEDKYYLLKSQHDSNLAELTALRGGDPTETIYTEGDVIYSEQPYYEETIYPGTVIMNSVPGETIISVPESQPVPNLQLEEIVPGSPIPAGESDSSIPKADGATGGDETTDIILNAPEFNVGYEDSGVPSISEVVIGRKATRGRNIDGLPGDEGLDLFLQTRTPNGTSELVTGELTISILDPAQPPERQRVGLWKFLEDEIPLFFANDEVAGRGILLHLPWDQAKPENSRLIIHARFITSDGVVFKTSSQIRINPPADGYSPLQDSVTGWTQRDSRWLQEPAKVNDDWQQSKLLQGDRSSAARRLPAIPTKAKIEKPRWRPVR